MEAGDSLHDKEERDIEMGFSDSSKVPIEPYLSDQWFVETGEIRTTPEYVCGFLSGVFGALRSPVCAGTIIASPGSQRLLGRQEV